MSFDEGSSASRKSLFESIVCHAFSYVMYISIMVLSYGVLINVVEACGVKSGCIVCDT